MRTAIRYIVSAALGAALMGGTSQAQECSTDAKRIVDTVYRQILERAENGEGAGAIERLAAGQTTVRELVRSIAHSREHVQKFMSGERAAAVTAAYRHVLGRDPDAGEIERHGQLLAAESPYVLIDELLDSAEYRRLYGDNGVPNWMLRYCAAG